MKLFTIGFTKTSAERVFGRMKRGGVRRVIDVRLNNVSQLAGFAKHDDLRYFAKELCGADYQHRPELAPTQEMLDGYKKQSGPWTDYEPSSSISWPHEKSSRLIGTILMAVVCCAAKTSSIIAIEG